MALTTQDLTKGLDCTGLDPITGADLNVLVESSEPKDDGDGCGRALIITTTDSALNIPVVPDAATNAKWRRYMWLRIPHSTATSRTPTIYGWNPEADLHATYLRWISITIDISDLTDDVAAAVLASSNAEAGMNDVKGTIQSVVETSTAAKTTADAAKTSADNASNAIDDVNASIVEATRIANDAFTLATQANAGSGISIAVSKILPGTAGQHIRTNDTASAVEWFRPVDFYAKFMETKPSGEPAGAAAAGVAITRLLNHVESAGAFVALDAVTGQFTIQPGTYRFFAIVPAVCDNQGSKAAIKVVATGSTVLDGTTIGRTNNTKQAYSIIFGCATFAAAATLAIQHYWGTARNATDSLGAPSSVSSEVYTILEIYKI